jgi:lipoprotein-releasing system ATP-binding protein
MSRRFLLDRSRKKILLSAKGIHKSYWSDESWELKVIKGVDLNIREGEILAVTGKSGVGKSTLLHILGALDRPTHGKVTLNSKNIFSMDDRNLANFRNQHIGFVFQFHHLLPEFTALENVVMPVLISKKDRETAFEKAIKLLDEVGLSDRLNHRPSELSGGEQQRVAFARSIINDPALVLADEPSGNLDQNNSDSLHRLIWDFVRRKNKTFVVVTHNKELAGQADRVIKIIDGKIHKIDKNMIG